MVYLGNILQYEQPTKYIVSSENYDDSYPVPVLTAGQTFVLGYTNETKGIYSNPLPVIIFDDFTTAVKFVNFPFKVKSSAMKILKPANENVYIPYWYYYLSNLKVDNELHKRYWISVFANKEVDFPPLSQQKQIAMRLDKIQELVSLQKKQIGKLEQLVKSRFLEMFGDPITNPKGWKKFHLGKITDIKIGPFGSLLHHEDYIQGGYALVNPSHIINEQIHVDMNFTVSEQKYKELSAYHLCKGDVIMGRRGEMGRCAVVCQDNLLCGTGSLFIRITGSLIPKYLQKTFSFPTFKKMIEDSSVGQTMQNLNVSIVSDFRVPVPPLPLQRQFAEFVEKTETQKALLEKRLNRLETLYKSLMQEYFG